jgi:hypothetical protein
MKTSRNHKKNILGLKLFFYCCFHFNREVGKYHAIMIFFSFSFKLIYSNEKNNFLLHIFMF